MTNTINELGQPIGFAVEKFVAPPRPNFNLLLGSSVRVESIALAHVPLLYKAFAIDSKGGNWTYMPYGPFSDSVEFAEWAKLTCFGRGDLWLVKFRSWAAHSFLLRMIEWHAQAENNWHCSNPPIGKRMSSWVHKDLWKDLHVIFAHFDSEDSWKALFYTMKLFKHLTAETAQSLRLSSMEELSENMMGLITTLKSSSL